MNNDLDQMRAALQASEQDRLDFLQKACCMPAPFTFTPNPVEIAIADLHLTVFSLIKEIYWYLEHKRYTILPADYDLRLKEAVAMVVDGKDVQQLKDAINDLKKMRTDESCTFT